MEILAAFFFNIIIIINQVLVPVIFSIAFLVFLWGVFQFWIAGGNEEKRNEGKKFVFSGLIGFVLMVSIWGLVNLLVNTLGFDSENTPRIPLFGDRPAIQGQQMNNSFTNQGQGSGNGNVFQQQGNGQGSVQGNGQGSVQGNTQGNGWFWEQNERRTETNVLIGN